MKLLSEGAEARVFSDGGKAVKQRLRKGYRLRELDEKLRLFRTRREAKILEKLKNTSVRVPKVISSDGKSATIIMEMIEGAKVRDALDAGNCGAIGAKIGEAIAGMHNRNVIHGDLTTSNMILKNSEVYFVDFGLGSFSDKAEDKAVDLHLLRRALSSSHSKIAKECFDAVLDSYRKKCGKSEEILKRLQKVETRGRHKGKKEARIDKELLQQFMSSFKDIREGKVRRVK